MGIVPDRFACSVTLTPDGTPESVTISNAWWKPVDIKLMHEFNLQSTATRIMVPDHELNPASNGREIRAEDRITVAGVAYNVAHARLKTVRTAWECFVQKEMI